MRPAIRVQNLSKRYRLGAKPAGRYITLRESLMDTLLAPLRRRTSNSVTRDQEFWALKDVSLEINPGEVVGIIGRNGAGKSTLLKILSRVTEPTRGRVELRGRVGSLLLLGALVAPPPEVDREPRERHEQREAEREPHQEDPALVTREAPPDRACEPQHDGLGSNRNTAWSSRFNVAPNKPVTKLWSILTQMPTWSSGGVHTCCAVVAHEPAT